MGNYMICLIDNKGFKPKLYDPNNVEHPIVIRPHHMCCLYGVKIANMLCGNRSIRQMYSTTKYFDAVGPVEESMPEDAYKYLI